MPRSPELARKQETWWQNAQPAAFLLAQNGVSTAGEGQHRATVKILKAKA